MLTRNSLAKLRTNYIDILYVHWWDWDTSIPEVMDNLHNLVVQGKVIYLVIPFLFSSHKHTLNHPIMIGRIRHPRVDRVQCEPVRPHVG